MTTRNKGEQLKIYVPSGAKVKIAAIAHQKGLTLTDYLKTLIERDTGLDLTVQQGRPAQK